MVHLLLGPVDQISLHGVSILSISIILGLYLANPGTDKNQLILGQTKINYLIFPHTGYQYYGPPTTTGKDRNDDTAGE